MIGKISKGTSMAGPLAYQERKIQKGVGERIGGNLFGSNAREMAIEFGLTQSLRPNLKNVVFNASLNLAPGENASNEDFLKMAEVYLQEMGFTNNQHVIFRHYDRDHNHIHLIISRITMDGQVVSDKNDYARSEKAMRLIEKQFGLTPVIDSKQAKAKQLSKGQIEVFRKTGQAPVQVQLQHIINEAIEDKPNLINFVHRLGCNGVNVHIHHNKDDVFGISYELDGVCFKGSSLGKGFTWNKLKNQIDYEHERDFKSISTAGIGRTEENTGGTSGTAAGDKYNEHQTTQGSTIARSGFDETVNNNPSRRAIGIEWDNSRMDRSFKEIKSVAIEAARDPEEYESSSGSTIDKGVGSSLLNSNDYRSSSSDWDEDEIERLRKKKKKPKRPTRDFDISI